MFAARRLEASSLGKRRGLSPQSAVRDFWNFDREDKDLMATQSSVASSFCRETHFWRPNANIGGVRRAQRHGVNETPRRLETGLVVKDQ
jgi:hypothetical protein